MSLTTLTQQDVSDGVNSLKACVDDTERANFNTLETHLGRFAYLFRNDPFLSKVFKDLPNANIAGLIEDVASDSTERCELYFSTEPLARISKGLAILMAIGEGELNAWKFADKC